MGGPTKAIIAAIAIILLGIVGLSSYSWNDAGRTVVVQYPNGGLYVETEAGPYPQWFGSEYKYNQLATIGFGTSKGDRSADVEAISVIFNDASRADISLMARVELPRNPEQMKELKRKYVSGYEHFLTACAVPVISNIVKLSANLRSSQEAYQTMSQFKTDIETQLKDGQYVTKPIEKWIMKATGDSERVKLTEVILDENGHPVTTTHDLKEMGCKVTIQELEVPVFDKRTQDMIARRKEEALQTEVRKQEAIRAEQEAITAEAKGKAEAMKVKWEKEKEKTAAVTEAEKKRDVAKLAQEAAGYKKREQILLGEGEAARKKLVMKADGALELKLKAYVESQRLWSDAFSKYSGNIVPNVEMGGSSSSRGANGMTEFMQIMSAKAAKDLSLDLQTK